MNWDRLPPIMAKNRAGGQDFVATKITLPGFRCNNAFTARELHGSAIKKRRLPEEAAFSYS
jgi:hypothetical protein